MLRRAVSIACGLVLLLPAATTVGTADAAPGDVLAKAAPKPVSKHVHLGHTPARFSSSRPSVRLTFHGRKGQLVELAQWSADTDLGCFRSSLQRAGGAQVKRWATGYWRLPRTATYTATLRPCRLGTPDGRYKAQVRKVVVQDAAIDGPATTVGSDPDVTHLVRLRLAEGERLVLDPSTTPRHVVRPGGRVDTPLPYGRIPLEVTDLPGSGRAGRYYVSAMPGSTLAVSRALDHRGVVDGAAVALANQGVASREHVVEFHGEAGQWVYPELLDSAGALVTDGRPRVGVIWEQGWSVNSYVMSACPGKSTSLSCVHLVPGPWQLPLTGTYRMYVAVMGSSAQDAFTVRVRAAATAKPLIVDGPPVTYTSTTPGQWVIGTYSEYFREQGPVVTASGASPDLTDWRMSLASGFPNQCPPYDTSNGCSDYWGVTLTPSKPSQLVPMDGNAGPSMAFLAVPPGVKGSLEVRLTSK